jgi:hypothetical protein
MRSIPETELQINEQTGILPADQQSRSDPRNLLTTYSQLPTIAQRSPSAN